jgi:hypothetical protein
MNGVDPPGPRHPNPPNPGLLDPDTLDPDTLDPDTLDPDTLDPDGLDRPSEIPNPARMYDWVLGGAANFEADRRAGQDALTVNPDGWLHAQANRAFLRRVVRYLAAAGIDQFVDLGSGVPTVDHVHQVAQHVNPAARVVYVDSDPVASTYGASLLTRDHAPGAAMLRADLRDAHRILHHPDTQRLIDLTRPVAVLMVAVLHFLADDHHVSELVSAYRAATAPGSYLALSHITGDDDPHIRDLQQLYQHTTMPFRTRTPDQLTTLFTGYEQIPPGGVAVSDWRPDPGPDPNRPHRDAFVGGLGQRPRPGAAAPRTFMEP